MLIFQIFLLLFHYELLHGKYVRLRRDGSNHKRQAKEAFDDIIMEALDDLTIDDIKDMLDGIEDVEKIGEGVINPNFKSSPQMASNLETCETTGFETRTREECEEVTEVECFPIQVTRTRSEIKTVCKTLVDLKGNCSVGSKEVPSEKCVEKDEKRCEGDFQLVPETHYKEDCFTRVQSICEEQIQLLRPYFQNATPSYPPHQHHHQLYPFHDTYGAPQLIQQPLPRNMRTEKVNLRSQLLKFLNNKSNKTQRRNKRSAVFSAIFPQIRTEEDRKNLRKALPNQITIKDLKTLLKSDPVNLTLKRKLRNIPSNYHPAALVKFRSLFPFLQGPAFGNPSTPPVLPQAFINDRAGSLSSGPPLKYPIPIPAPPDPIQQYARPPSLPPSHSPGPPPLVTTHELPAPPGCRSLATRTCHKIPYVITRKVPFETCKTVPGVECHAVLKTVPELDCGPTLAEDCNDVEQQIPYLKDEEECEEITFDDCIPIVEEVPIQVCTRSRKDESMIFLQKGQIFRKEGEKSRKKTGRRKTGGDGTEKDNDL